MPTPKSPLRTVRGLGSAALLSGLLLACNSDPTGNTAGDCAAPSDLGSCPAWNAFSPVVAAQAPAPTSTAPSVQESTVALERFDDVSGDLVNLGPITFVCTSQEYNFVNRPEEAFSLNIDETVIWPGALIQGRSHRDASAGGADGLLELPIRERAPVEVSVTFNNQNSTQVVTAPTPGTVNGAVRTMIGTAQGQGLATANTITFSQETYTSEQQAAIAFGVSGRYLGFEASASGSVTSSVSTSVVAAQLRQQMFVVNVTQPSTPAAFFSGADAAFGQQAGLDRVGPGNPPLYVSRIGYGRMMVFSMSAKASAEEIKGALSVAYNGLAGGAGGTLSAKQTNILSSAQIRIAQVGGDQASALAAIQSGDLSDYFTDVVPLTAAQPIWFELKALTGEVAKVSEPGTYTETTCVPKLPGTFEYKSVQNVTIPFTAGTQRSALQADVNGDGRMDLVFNERRTAPALNRVHVALASATGTFALQPAWTHTQNPAEGWENFDHFMAADVDGDGSSDLVWNTLGAVNALYTAISLDNGSYQERVRQQHANGGWSGYRARAGDIDGDGQADLVWNYGGSPTALRTYHALAQGDTTFFMSAPFYDLAGNFSAYSPQQLAQFDGANGLDFVINALGSTFNNAYVFRFTPTTGTVGTWSFPTPFVSTVGGWGGYRMVVGNVDGQNGADLVWVHPPTGRTYRALNTGSGAWVTNTPTFDDNLLANNVPFMADFNNDGNSDLLLVGLATDSNKLRVGLGRTNGTFSYPAGVQQHPVVPTLGWETYDDIFVGDVNGDGKADVVWTNPAADAQIYVALAK